MPNFMSFFLGKVLSDNFLYLAVHVDSSEADLDTKK